MADGSIGACPRCGTAVSDAEGFCRQCGYRLAVHGRLATLIRSVPNPWLSLVHVAAVTVAILALVLGDQLVHLCGVSILLLVAASLRLHYRTTPQYRVSKRRAEVRRSLKGARISVAVPLDDGTAGQMLTVGSTVIRFPDVHRDEVIVRADAPLSTPLLGSELLSLWPLRSGESFAALLERGRMDVRVLLIDRSYLSLARGNVFASRAVRRNPPVDIGPGLAVFEHRPVASRLKRRPKRSIDGSGS